VIGHGARDDLVLRRLALQLPVVLRELPRGLDGLAASGGEEHPIEIAGRVVGEAVGQLDGRGMRVGPEREERELLRLLRRDLREPLPAVAGVHHEESAEPVDIPAAVGVPDVMALAAGDDGHAVPVLHHRLPGEVHPEVVFRLLLEVRVARVAREVGDGLFGCGHRVPQL
jgi:hypothetical protein